MSGNTDELQGKDIVLLNLQFKPAGADNKAPENNNKEDNFDLESKNSNMDTLDESVTDTLKRDFVRMINKLEYVLIPRTIAAESKQLRNCKK